jgi:sugar/nucleoside kinase (ribokinase family)
VLVEFDVICVGASNLDTIVAVDHVPADDERMTATDFITAGGGPAATAAVALARLGARVAMCGVVGDDREGEIVRALLEEERVDTRWLRTDASATTARAVVLASDSTGGRSIVTTVAPEPSVDEIPIGESTWIHADQTGYRSVARALGGSGGGTLLSVDAGNPIRDLTLDGVELYAPTLAALLLRYEAGDREGAFAAASASGASQLVATDGANGSWVATATGIQLVPSFAVDVVSTLGAGDVFHGALLAGLVQGLSLLKATTRANAAGALACTQIDGRSGIPTSQELDSFLRTRAVGVAPGIAP